MGEKHVPESRCTSVSVLGDSNGNVAHSLKILFCSRLPVRLGVFAQGPRQYCYKVETSEEREIALELLN